MKVRTLFLFSLATLAACSDNDPTRPDRSILNGPAAAVSDGSTGGNPDFWFLPPMVDNPTGNPLYLDHGATTSVPAMVQITDITSGLPGTIVLAPSAATAGTSQYQYDWIIPDGADKVYRVAILVGDDTLGFADIRTASSPGKAKNATTNEEIILSDGRNLPIKFVIEQFALCDPAGTLCSQGEIDLSVGGEVTIDIPGYGRSGVTIPPQPGGGTTTITLRVCGEDDPESGFTDMNPAVTDIPTYGPCLSVNADPPLSEVMPTTSGLLVVPATVFICDITVDLGVMAHEQQERITMHRWDNGPDQLHALPHAAHACAPSVSSTETTGFFANLTRGSFRAAGRALVSLLTPRPLYAAVMLDVGAGGFTRQFSAFQFALPSKIAVVGTSNFGNVTEPVNPTVLITDLGGDPVEGATVRFVTSPFECDPNAEPPSIASVIGTMVTPANGQATTSWTVNAGAQTLYACGRGLGGDNVSGPRDEVDPFQPLSTTLEGMSVPNGPEVLVQTGSVQFTACGADVCEIILKTRSGASAVVNRK